ncbi:MAG TPA: LacI family DNA-binding transcriptional regulator, partial [Candidatus Methylacidiphilales bacterium]
MPMGKAKPIRIRDVAREAGCHYTTVSLALRNDPRLPPVTRRRIQKIASRLGYRPNPLVSKLFSSLRKNRLLPELGVIGFLDTRKRPAGQPGLALENDPFYKGARKRAEESGYSLDLHHLAAPNMSARRMKDILLARGVRGLVINSSHVPRGHLSLDVSPFACALRGYSQMRPNLHRICHNHFQSLLLAIHFLRHLGYRKIGLVLPRSLDALVNEQWSAGFLSHQQHLPASLRVPLLMPPRITREETARWFRRHKPEAVLSPDAAVRDWLREEGVDIPGDASFACLDLEHNPQHPDVA